MDDMMLFVDDNDDDLIADADGRRVAATCGDDDETRRMLAKRLVLCWNACRGYSNDQIAAGVTPNKEIGRLRAALEVAMQTLEQIATTPRNAGARRNAYATVEFLRTQLKTHNAPPAQS